MSHAYPFATLVLLMLAAFILGSIPFAIIFSRLFGLPDPRKTGSGNPGATNVMRSGHKIAALGTLLGDASKGLIAVVVCQFFFPEVGTVGFALVGFCAFLGHIYSLFLRGRGGKGVATAIGVLLMIYPTLALSLIAIWLLVFILFKYSSLAALVAAASAPVLYLFMTLQHDTFHPWVFGVILAISAFLTLKHKKNIHNLWQGKEPKMTKKER